MEAKKTCSGTARRAQTATLYRNWPKRVRVCTARPSTRHQTPTFANLHGQSSSADDDSPHDEASSDSLTRELREYVSEETHNTNKRHLDLLFEISASSMTKNRQASEASRTECDTCRGTGEIECPYCHGTGALTIGDVLFCDTTGCKKCVVCRNGLVQCSRCNGYGRYARWMQPPN